MTHGPGLRHPGSAPHPPGRTRVGLLVGLVLVLLSVCGGIAVTAWQVVGDSAPAALGPSWAPPARRSVPSRTPPHAPVAPSVSATSQPGPPGVPAGFAAVPFGISHTVIWPDHLQAVVRSARRHDLPNGLAIEYPAAVAVVIRIEISNATVADVTINQARLRLWYGAERRPAFEFEDAASRLGGGFDNTIRSGGKVVGDFAFVVPLQYLGQLVVEFHPRPGDAPGLFAGSVD
jgi:hypothetical protein